jgi:hypothetical protein
MRLTVVKNCAKTQSPQRKFFSSTDLARFAPLRNTLARILFGSRGLTHT